MPLWDAYGRPLLNLRLVVTMKCNFRCFFCHSEGLDKWLEDRLTPSDYEIIAEAAYKLGINSFKITGGEPLIRRDIVEIVEALRRGNPRADISMTTNGYFLSEYATKLADAGLNRVNVSLHTLNPEKFKNVTGVRGLDKVVKGVIAAHEHGLRVKINTVILRGVNVDEIDMLIDFASRVEAKLQLIELHPVGIAREVFEKYHYPYRKILDMLMKKAVKVRYRSELHNRVILVLDNGVEVEIVGPTGNPVFCSACTRIRLTPDGAFTPCLNRGVDRVYFIDELRAAEDRSKAVNTVITAIVRVNALRRPYYMYTLDTPAPPCKKRVPRLGIPKRDGRLMLPKRWEERLLHEWTLGDDYCSEEKS